MYINVNLEINKLEIRKFFFLIYANSKLCFYLKNAVMCS